MKKTTNVNNVIRWIDNEIEVKTKVLLSLHELAQIAFLTTESRKLYNDVHEGITMLHILREIVEKKKKDG